MSFCLYPAVGEPLFYTISLEPPELLPASIVTRLYDTDAELKSFLTNDLNARRLERVGYSVESGRHALPAHTGEFPPYYTGYVADLLGERGVPGDLLAQQMNRKTPYEVEKVVAANQVAAHGLRVFFQSVRPGVTEVEVAGKVEAAIHGQTGQQGCKMARGWGFVQAGPNSARAGSASRSSSYALQTGDLVVLEMATMVDGYWSDLTRTLVVGGQIAPAQQALMSAVREAQTAALATVRAGVRHADVDRAARSVLEQHGFGQNFIHHTGHHVGFRYHDHGPSLLGHVNEPLLAGNIITIEPGAYGHGIGGGCRFEENVLVTEEGYRVLSPYHLTGD